VCGVLEVGMKSGSVGQPVARGLLGQATTRALPEPCHAGAVGSSAAAVCSSSPTSP